MTRPTNNPHNIVTGAFSYTGKYITRRLLGMGQQVATLTSHPERPHEFGNQVPAYPFDFDDPTALARRMEGAHTLYNTYWVRFDHGRATYTKAVENTRILLRAARQAGIQRIVHVSITNPSLSSPLPYFYGKALLEQDIRESGLSYAILRPTVIFGPEDILINNIAYLLRRFPVFALPGSGQYRLQPIFVEDMAHLAVEAGQQQENITLDAVGPETFTFEALVRQIALSTGSRAGLLRLPPGLVLTLSRLLGRVFGDVVLTRDEIDGLMAGLLVSENPPTGTTPLSGWLKQHAGQVGRRYASELQRHYHPSPGWGTAA